MLKYKQIWHGIKLTRWLIKFNLTNLHIKKTQLPNKLHYPFPCQSLCHFHRLHQCHILTQSNQDMAFTVPTHHPYPYLVCTFQDSSIKINLVTLSWRRRPPNNRRPNKDRLLLKVNIPILLNQISSSITNLMELPSSLTFPNSIPMFP